jgi:predicted hydrocarbon binding protein
MRMCLLDVETSFYGLRKSVEGIVGEAAATLFYESGIRGGLRYAKALLEHGSMTPDETGYRHAIHEYSVGGFGAFEIRELDFAAGRGVIACVDPMAFEAYAALANGDRRPQPVCDFGRGVLVGLLEGFTGREGIGGFEEMCRATGASECRFLLDEEEVTRQASINRNLGGRLQKPRP